MGLRTMASPNGAQAPDCSQGLLNHSFEEFHGYLSELGKPAYKMNFGELVNTVQQQFQAPTSSPSSSSSMAPSLPADCNLNGTLSQKTAHGVLQDIAGQEEHGCGKRLAAFGEDTMENLLIQAGTLNPGCEERSQSLFASESSIRQQPKWMQYESDSAKQQQQSMGFLGSNLPIFGNAIMNAGFSENQHAGMTVVPVAMAKSNSSDSQMPADINRNEEIVDKSIERRQKRMIKNRESAARSRARKQAYINQLEDKVRKLEDMNMRLKRQMEEMLTHSAPLPEPRHQLRRTSSAPF